MEVCKPRESECQGHTIFEGWGAVPDNGISWVTAEKCALEPVKSEALMISQVKDKRFPKAGSPFQMNFPGEGATPQAMEAADEKLPACGDSSLRCSCGDCPDATSCEPVRSQPRNI